MSTDPETLAALLCSLNPEEPYAWTHLPEVGRVYYRDQADQILALLRARWASPEAVERACDAYNDNEPFDEGTTQTDDIRVALRAAMGA